MTVGVYSVRDRKANKFINVFTEENDETAKRTFGFMRKDKNTIFGMFPEDYELWFVGGFDDHNGLIVETNRYVDGGGVIE